MEQENKKTAQWKKAVIRTACAVLSVLLIGFFAIAVVWHNEISALAGMRLVRERQDDHLDGAVYTMTVRGGFYLDEFVEQGGVKSDAELIEFITSKITKGLLNMNIRDPEIGCSSFTAKTENGDVLFGRNYDFSKTNTYAGVSETGRARFQDRRLCGHGFEY